MSSTHQLRSEVRDGMQRRGQVRVNTSLLNELVNYAGEVSLSRSRMEQQIYSFRDNLGELEMQLREVSAQVDSGAQDKQLQLGLLGSSDVGSAQRQSMYGLVDNMSATPRPDVSGRLEAPMLRRPQLKAPATAPCPFSCSSASRSRTR